MSNYECTPERFAKDVSKHVMTVELDQGCHRSLLFKEPGCITQYFRLNTWPGHLAISGDMGSFVFSRTHDMFSFFRNDSGGINVGYWVEKLMATDAQDGHREFDGQVFKSRIVEEFRSYWEGTSNYEDRRECWQAVREDLLDIDFQHELEARNAVNEFSHGDLFVDFWETRLTKPTYRLIWAMRAIVWGIQQYDEATKATSEAAA